MLDGIEFERRGVPAAVICTDQFVNTGRAMAQVAGLPNYEFAIVPHPTGNLTEEETRARAAAAIPKIMEILTGRRAAP